MQCRMLGPPVLLRPRLLGQLVDRWHSFFSFELTLIVQDISGGMMFLKVQILWAKAQSSST